MWHDGLIRKNADLGLALSNLYNIIKKCLIFRPNRGGVFLVVGLSLVVYIFKHHYLQKSFLLNNNRINYDE